MIWIDFLAIKSAVSCVMVLLDSGWQPVQTVGRSHRGPCPFCSRQGSTSRKFSANWSGYKCHSCQRNGDVIRLVSELRNMSAQEAAHWLIQRFHLAVPRHGHE